MCNIRTRYFQIKYVVKYLYVNIMYDVCISIQLMRLIMFCKNCKLHKVSLHDKIFPGHTTFTLTPEQNIWRHALKMLYLSYFNLSIDTR